MRPSRPIPRALSRAALPPTAALAAALFLAACGGGGGGGTVPSGEEAPPQEIVTPPDQDLRGTYALQGFTIRHDSGEVRTQDDAGLFHGLMTIDADSVFQQITIDELTAEGRASYVVEYTTGTTEGVFHLTGSDGASSQMLFRIAGNGLTTETRVEASGYTESDDWLKTSDHEPAAQRSGSAFRVVPGGGAGALCLAPPWITVQ